MGGTFTHHHTITTPSPHHHHTTTTNPSDTAPWRRQGLQLRRRQGAQAHRGVLHTAKARTRSSMASISEVFTGMRPCCAKPSCAGGQPKELGGARLWKDKTPAPTPVGLSPPGGGSDFVLQWAANPHQRLPHPCPLPPQKTCAKRAPPRRLRSSGNVGQQKPDGARTSDSSLFSANWGSGSADASSSS
jgi:hypothetical protein